MKQHFFLLLTTFMAYFTHAQNVWSPVDSMKGPGKSVASAFVLNNEGYVVGGLTAEDFTRKMYSYNAYENDWDDAPSWGGETGNGQNRGSSTSFVINQKAYIGLGQGNSALFYKDWWVYNPVDQTWTQLSDFTGTERQGAVGFNLHNVGYVGLGQDLSGLCKDFYKYNATSNTWAQLTDFNGSARKFSIGVTMGDQAYVGFGDDGVYKNDFWQYDEFSDEWIQKASLPSLGRSGATAWGIFPNLFVACGENNEGTFLNDVWEYNYFGNVWVQRPSLPGPPRKHPVSFVIYDVAFVGAGYGNNQFLDDFYSYFATLGSATDESIAMQLYPNPSSDFIHIQSAIPLIQYSIYSIDGKLISSDVFSEKIAVSQLANGRYLLILEDNLHQYHQEIFEKYD